MPTTQKAQIIFQNLEELGFAFDNEIYEKMEPQLCALWNEAKATGGDNSEALDYFIDRGFTLIGEWALPYFKIYYRKSKLSKAQMMNLQPSELNSLLQTKKQNLKATMAHPKNQEALAKLTPERLSELRKMAA